MTDYDLLGLMDTYKALKQQQIEVPDTFAEFISNLTPIDNNGTLRSRPGAQEAP